tara:strand:- start:5720 stop:6004 length:285 start_codon:yes stop_codon:yes gene_type:complete
VKHETKYLRIHGTVQGVGYRAWAQEIGQKMNLTGWIRNLRKDRSVEAVVTGDEDQIQKFISLLYKGPAASKVAAIEVSDGVDEDLKSFEIRDTV